MTTRTFNEAIVSEYYQLLGYFVETGVILKAVRGREEVDMVAVRYDESKGLYHILHGK